MTVARSLEVPASLGLNWLARRRLYVVPALTLGAAALIGRNADLRLVVAVFGSIGLVLLLPNLRFGPALLIGAVGVVPFSIGTGTESRVGLAMVGVAALFALWLVTAIPNGQAKLPRSPATPAWLALVTVAGISIVAGHAFWNPWVQTKSTFPLVQLGQWSIYLMSAFAFWLPGLLIPDRRTLRATTWLLMGFGLLFTLRLLIPHLTLLNFNLYGSIVFRVWIVALTSAFAMFRSNLPIMFRALLLAAAIALLVVPVTREFSSQSSWVPQLVVLGAVVTLRLGQSFPPASVASGAVLIGTMAIVIAPWLASVEVFSLETRLIAWRGLFHMLEGHWLIGLGLGSYWHYWRYVISHFAYVDPSGFLHMTRDPLVNMHNQYLDVLGQMGLVGVLVLLWLVAAITVEIWHAWRYERDDFGRAFVAACTAGFVGMLFAGMLADWIFPFVYNIGLHGFRDSYVGWFMLGGLVVLRNTRSRHTRSGSDETGATVRPVKADRVAEA